MSQTAIQRHLWSREEYERMIEAGVFHPEARLELIDGEIINMTPQGSFHATAVQLTADLLRTAFSSGFVVRTQLPLALDDNSEPEPDIAVVSGSATDYRDAHPSRAALIIEVADSTLSFDRQQKKKLYARNGIPEYWIINLVEQQLEIHRDPEEKDYNENITLQKGQSIAPLSAPDNTISVTDILP